MSNGCLVCNTRDCPGCPPVTTSKPTKVEAEPEYKVSTASLTEKLLAAAPAVGSDLRIRIQRLVYTIARTERGKPWQKGDVSRVYWKKTYVNIDAQGRVKFYKVPVVRQQRIRALIEKYLPSAS